VRPPSIDLVREIADLFDGADSRVIQPRRSSSVTSLQALFFLNDDSIREYAEELATRLHALPTDAARIRRAFLILYGRDATAAELEAGRKFLDGWVPREEEQDGRRRRDDMPPAVLGKWRAYLQVLFAANEFIFID